MKISILDQDSNFMDLLGKFTDLAILSMLFFLTSIPLVTIGAGLTALYEAVVESVRGKKAYPYRVYLDTFKKKWKLSTALWILYVLAALLMVFNVFFALHQYNQMGMMLLAADVPVSILLGFQIVYSFPLIAKGYTGFGNVIKMAFMYGIAHLPYSLLALVFLLGGVTLITMTYGVLGVLLPGFIILLLSLVLEKVFARYIEEDNEDEEE